MRIISGIARNLELLPPADETVRPTLGRSREALFSALGDLTGRRVLDLFAGSGALGLEALSRGAASLVQVEIAPKNRPLLEENLRRVRNCGVTAPAEIILGDALDVKNLRRRLGDADLIFADPPYAQSVNFFTQLIADDSFNFPDAELIWEIPDLPGSAGPMIAALGERAWRLRKFGSVAFLQVNL